MELDAFQKEAPISLPKNGALPLVSVVVPTYNRVELLRETLVAILSQTFKDFEALVVDSSSTDGTEDFAAGINDARVRYFKKSADGLVATGRNLGIRNSLGRYVAFCDDDDLWIQDKLSQQVEFMEQNPDVVLSFGYAVDFGDTGSAGCLRYPKNECDSAASFDALIMGNKITASTVMVRKAGLDKTGLFDETPEFRAIEDYDLWLRLARNGRIACMPRVLCKYRVHEGALTRNPYKENLKLLKLIGKFRDNRWANEKLLKKAEANVSRMIGNAALLTGDVGYRQWYLGAFRLYKAPKTIFPLLFALMPEGVARRLFACLKNVKIKGFQRARLLV